MKGRCYAAEKYSLDETLAHLPVAEAHARTLLSRLGLICHFEPGAAMLDIGAAQGRFLVACARLGFDAQGIEPWDDAIRVAAELARHQGVNIRIVQGMAESMPFPSDYFQIVHAMSVVEHVQDVRRVFAEVHRVLKPGGIFWFYTASSLCPRQGEISGFPCFGWYPDSLKRRIMAWAADKKPHLVGHTSAPAINWFSPWKARRMLRQAGFGRIYDRWDLPCLPSSSRVKRALTILIRSTTCGKLVADVLRPGCAYAAIKPGEAAVAGSHGTGLTTP